MIDTRKRVIETVLANLIEYTDDTRDRIPVTDLKKQLFLFVKNNPAYKNVSYRELLDYFETNTTFERKVARTENKICCCIVSMFGGIKLK